MHGAGFGTILLYLAGQYYYISILQSSRSQGLLFFDIFDYPIHIEYIHLLPPNITLLHIFVTNLCWKRICVHSLHFSYVKGQSLQYSPLSYRDLGNLRLFHVCLEKIQESRVFLDKPFCSCKFRALVQVYKLFGFSFQEFHLRICVTVSVDYMEKIDNLELKMVPVASFYNNMPHAFYR